MTTRPLELDDIRDIVTVSDTAIVSDGTAVVFVRRGTAGSRTETALWLATADGATRRLTAGPADRAPRVCASGVLFLRDVSGVPQLHLLPERGEAQCLTDLPLGAGPAAMSPDGRHVAFTASVNRAAGVPASPIVIDTLDDKEDGRGWIGAVRRHVFVLALDTLRVRPITDGDFDAGEPAWSPDGNRLAFVAGLAPGADLSRERRAYAVELDDPLAPLLPLGHARGLAGPVVWTPDGGSVVAVGMPAPAVGNARLLRLHLDGRDDVDLTAGLDRNVMPGAPGYPGGRPALTPDGEHIVFCARDRGWTHLYSVRLADGHQRRLVSDPHYVVSALSVASAAARAAVVVTTPASFAEVAIVDLERAEHTTLTNLMGASLPGVELHRPEPRQFKISDGTVVHGWITEAPGTEGSGPLLLDIHGGPHNAWAGVADDIHLYQQLLVSRGWRVLTLNPRGSDGYGEEFLRAIDGGWGRDDLRDFLEPIDQLVAEGIAHPDQLAVTGYSYGGLSTCALTSHTNRFAAAAAGGLLCDFAAVGGQHLPEGFFAAMTSNASPLDVVPLTRLSPISRVGRVHTPTLVLHGADDDTCPVEQARQWFTALRLQGVPSRLVVYPGGNHLFIADGPIDHRVDYHARVVAWMEQHTRSAPRPAAISPAPHDPGHWRRRLELLCDRYAVPGAQFGIVQLDANGVPFDRVIAGAGTTDVSTGEPVTETTIFQIGSITKVWTTTLVMQLVDEGLLDLDAPVRRYLPDFALGDDPSPAVTVRQLLTHTSGIDGDVFTDTGTGDDCVRLYVEQLAPVGRIHEPGARFSYCNSGFVVAGRIVEALRSLTWDEALRRYVIEPLGLDHTISRTEDAPRFSAAVGHSGDPATPVPTWPITRSMGPAGLVVSDLGDLLAFAETALRGGVAPNGTRILSDASARAMTRESVDLRGTSVATQGWGLGWFLQDWNGRSVYGHDGGTIGQRAFLRVFPETGFALALLTNGGRADGLAAELLAEASAAIDGSTPPPPLRPDPARPVDAPPGCWEAAGLRVEVSTEDGEARISITDLKDVLRSGEQREPVSTSLYATDLPGVYAHQLPDIAGWEQFRPVQAGAYLGYRFLPEVTS
ncbi:serine hydrolase [Streptomyces scopuliridis]|uniref:serine hydrolase n=1 Tax=Streptomyces scopuliridis TaxID=452529 RepID=UPI0036BD0107